MRHVHLIFALILSAFFVGPASAQVDFDTQIIPLLTKQGCNAGACHGSATGQAGFKLSLWGADAAADYDAVVRQSEGRRVNVAKPDRSLVYLKPAELLNHDGGLRVRSDSDAERLLLQWLAEGAQRLRSRRLNDLHVTVSPIGDANDAPHAPDANETGAKQAGAKQTGEPSSDADAARHSNILENVGMSAVLDRPGERARLRVTAKFDDGATRDVTAWTVFTPDDKAAVELDAAGVATVKRRGQHTVIARFLDRVVAVRLIVPLRDEPVDLSPSPKRNFIDDHVLATLATLRLPPSPQADDAAFLRRVTLDLTGRLPTPSRIRAFLADERDDKRDRVIDELLASDAFNDLQAYRYATLFQINSKRLQPEGAAAFHRWLRDRVAANTPFDQLARAMLTTTGDSYELGAANFARIAGEPRLQAEFVTQSLMGVRLRCANCHDHPLDRWKQDDYHGLAAILAKVKPSRVVTVSERGDVTHPVTGEPARPRLPGVRFLDENDDGLRAFADWLTHDDNRYFARATVNRLWAQMMGRGLVEPIDDLRATNPATHPALLDKLAADFIAHGYDVKRTLRLIARSAAYQRSSRATKLNDADDRFYSHARTKPLSAEVLVDAITDATGMPETYADRPPGTRAVTLEDPLIPSRTLDVLGRCDRTDACTTDAADSAGLARTLHLINGDLLNARVTAKDGRLAKLLASGRSDDDMLTELYLATLSRPPSSKESAHWRAVLAEVATDDARRAVYEDLFWALLSSKAFSVNQ